jgi:hypothetical protein
LPNPRQPEDLNNGKKTAVVCPNERNREFAPPTSPYLRGHSVQVAEIARGCGVIRLYSGTGDKRPPLIHRYPVRLLYRLDSDIFGQCVNALIRS